MSTRINQILSPLSQLCQERGFLCWPARAKPVSLCPLLFQLLQSPTELGPRHRAHPGVPGRSLLSTSGQIKPLSSVGFPQAGEGSPPHRALPPHPPHPWVPLGPARFPLAQRLCLGHLLCSEARGCAPAPHSPAFIGIHLSQQLTAISTFYKIIIKKAKGAKKKTKPKKKPNRKNHPQKQPPSPFLPPSPPVSRCLLCWELAGACQAQGPPASPRSPQIQIIRPRGRRGQGSLGPWLHSPVMDAAGIQGRRKVGTGRWEGHGCERGGN